MRSEPESILLVLPSLTALGGGIELYLRQFLEALIEIHPGAELVAVLGREPKLARPELLSAALRARLRVVGARSERRSARVAEFLARVAAETLRQRPGLVVCGHVNYAAVSAIVTRVCGARSIVLTYGIEAWGAAGAITTRAMRDADRVVSISRYTAEQLVRAVGVPPARIGIVHNAVDVERFTPGAPDEDLVRRLADLPRPLLLTVCRLDATEAYKGVDMVIRTLADRPGVAGSYLVVGDGSDRARLERLAKELKAPVRFWGRATDAELPHLYRASDLFVMPSRKEGFGYVFIEAMACGLPTVAGGVDGSVDALADGALGVLVNPLDLDEIAGAIRAQLGGETPPNMRDPRWLHDEVRRRFSMQAFTSRLREAMEEPAHRDARAS